MPSKKVRAILQSGEVVELKKDCGCLDSIHIGPHWLHMDAFDKADHERLMKQALETNNVTLFQRVGRLEIERLKDKEAEMRAAGIVEILQ